MKNLCHLQRDVRVQRVRLDNRIYLLNIVYGPKSLSADAETSENNEIN